MATLTEEGLLSFRLQEPIASLALTPFAARAAIGSKAATVGELASLIFERDKECLGMGQGHIEEIRRKIEQFVGSPPYPLEQQVDFGSLLRLALLSLESLDRSIIAIRCQVQTIAAIPPQEIKEAEMALLRDRDGKFARAIEAAQQKADAALRPLLEQLFIGLIRPWLIRQGGIAHEREFKQFCFERSTDLDSTTFGHLWTLLEHITSKGAFLFAPLLSSAPGGLWAISEKERTFAAEIIEDAKILSQDERANLNELARVLFRCRSAKWQECTPAIIERILFWGLMK